MVLTVVELEDGSSLTVKEREDCQLVVVSHFHNEWVNEEIVKSADSVSRDDGVFFIHVVVDLL